MKRAFLVALYGAATLPLGAALWLLVETMWVGAQLRVAVVTSPFLDWNGHTLPVYPCLAVFGAATSLALYGLMCALFRLFK